jgi:spore coat polysaccharide biosynthesis protein SpsF
MSAVVCVVQARTGSTRLPGKVLQDLGGRTMLRFMLDRLVGLDGVEVVVATSTLGRDDAVAEIAASAKCRTVRGPERDVLGRFAIALDESPAEHVVRLTADCPLMDAGLVRAVLDVHLASDADYTSNVFPRTFP